MWNLLLLLVTFTPNLCKGSPAMGSLKDPEAVYETFKFNLIRYYGVKEPFAEQFKQNLKRAVSQEIERTKLKNEGSPSPFPRQIDEDEEEEEEVTGPTTQGPSPFNIVQGIYGILQGVGTLNPDKVLGSTVNFFPPSQKQTAQALISSALGQNPGTWPTPTTTTPTTTKATTKDPDEDYDEDEEATTKVAAVGTIAPTVTTSLVPTSVSSSGLDPGTLAPPVPHSSTTVAQDDEFDPNFAE